MKTLRGVRRQQKAMVVEQLREKFTQCDVAVLTRYTGLKVPEINELRDELKRIHTEYRVVKNTLVRRAIEGTEVAVIKDLIEGPLAIAFAKGDIVPVAKLLTSYAKEHPQLQIHAGWMRGRILNAKEVESAATLPGKEELVAKLLFLLNSPVVRLMSIMREIPGRLVRTLSEIQKQKEKSP
jgi:large subunit ribosomal protein L10